MQPPTASSRGGASRAGIAAAAALTGGSWVASAVWLALRLPGSPGASDIATVTVAPLAALAGLVAAGRATGRGSRGWLLLAASSALWALGELSWTLRQLAA